MQRVSTDRLIRDLGAVAADVDELVKSTAGNASEAIAEARARLEVSLRAAKQNLENSRQCAAEEARSLAQSTNSYLRENVWTALGVAGGIGLLLGAIVGLKSQSSGSHGD
jgi:ElaB/YqjD/DUF883 family membrane-anchored ribosome-binding protein